MSGGGFTSEVGEWRIVIAESLRWEIGGIVVGVGLGWNLDGIGGLVRILRGVVKRNSWWLSLDNAMRCDALGRHIVMNCARIVFRKCLS